MCEDLGSGARQARSLPAAVFAAELSANKLSWLDSVLLAEK